MSSVLKTSLLQTEWFIGRGTLNVAGRRWWTAQICTMRWRMSCGQHWDGSWISNPNRTRSMVQMRPEYLEVPDLRRAWMRAAADIGSEFIGVPQRIRSVSQVNIQVVKRWRCWLGQQGGHAQ